MKSSLDAKELLKEVAAHLAYDAGVTGSKFSQDPCGRLPVSQEGTGGLWGKISTAIENDSKETAVEILRKLVDEATADAKSTGKNYGIVKLSGELWAEVCSHLGTTEPENMIFQMVGHAIEKEGKPLH
jgi:hypothetical protein